MASHSVTDVPRLRFLPDAAAEASTEAPRPSGHRSLVLQQLALGSLPYWRRRRLLWKEMLLGLSGSGALLLLWLYCMSRLA